MHPSLQRTKERLKQTSCRAKTIKGMLRWIEKNGLPEISSPKYRKRNKWEYYEITDKQMAIEAMELARKERPRIKNWDKTIATHMESGIQAINYGRYSSRCKYDRFRYVVKYNSYAKISKTRKVVEFYQNNKLLNRILLKEDLQFFTDVYGIAVKDIDGTEYHPTADDFKSSNFIRRVRRQIQINRIKREKAKIKNEEFDKFKDKVLVTYKDSRMAGNCYSGTISFIENKLKLDRSILSNIYANISGLKLQQIDNSIWVKGAISIAIMRETMVSI